MTTQLEWRSSQHQKNTDKTFDLALLFPKSNFLWQNLSLFTLLTQNWPYHILGLFF